MVVDRHGAGPPLLSRLRATRHTPMFVEDGVADERLGSGLLTSQQIGFSTTPRRKDEVLLCRYSRGLRLCLLPLTPGLNWERLFFILVCDWVARRKEDFGFSLHPYCYEVRMTPPFPAPVHCKV